MALSVQYGVRQKVYVSHVAEDGTFFVQLETDDAYRLAELSQTINDFIATQSGSHFVPEYGLKCFAFSTRDQTWYRALISDVDGTKVTVYYVDYGNTEKLSLENISSPSDALFESPYQAVCCSLSDFVPLKDGCQALPDVLLDNEFSGNFVSRGCQKHPYLSFLPCNNLTLYQDENATDSIAQQLVTNGHGQFHVCADDITVGSRQKVYTCFHDSPGKFWVQLASTADSLDGIMDDLNDPNTVGRLKPLPVEALVSGVACCCQYSEDNRYYRAEVIGRAKGSKCKVSFVDYGNCEVVDQSDIKELPARFAVPPFCAIQCCLDGVTPVKPDRPDPKRGLIAWNEKACDAFVSVTDGKELDALFVSEFSPEIFDVRLTDTESKTEIARLLAQSGHAMLSAEELEVPTASAVDYQYISLDVGKTYKDVFVTHADSPAVVWCQLPDHVADFDLLTDRLSECAPSLPPCVALEDNQPCCVKYAIDDSWCRGLISSVDRSSGNAQVLFVDYGNTETVDLADVRDPLPELLSLPAQAVSFSMAGMSPIGEWWSQAAIDSFREMSVNKTLTCEVVGLDEDGYPSAKLFDHLQQNMDIGLELVRRGHAKAPLGVAANKSAPPPARTQEVQPSLCSNFTSHSRTSSKGSDQSPFQSKKESASHSLSVGESRSWSRERHSSNRSTSSNSSSRSAQEGSPGRSHLQRSRDQSPSSYRSLKYRRVRLQTGEDYEVSVCHVESLNEFYCQLHRNADRLLELMERIDQHCNSAKARPVSSPTQNMPVLAKFSGDGVWCRAIVKQPPSGKGCLVVFVDYGNSETVLMNNLAEIPPPFTTLESQAIQCALIGVPRTFDPPESTIDAFGELVINNTFKFLVKKFVRDKELNVGELLCQNGGSLIDQLKEKGLVPAASPRGSSNSSSRESSQKRYGTVRSPQSQKQQSRPAQQAGIPLPQLPLKESVDVVSSFTGSPSLFYLQISENYLSLEQISTDINEFYSKVFDYEHKLSRPNIGDFCAAKFSEDDLWYRARVTRVDNAQVDVLYVDYGNSETVGVGSIKVLQPQFTRQPCIAIPCSLAGLNTSSSEVIQKFVERVTDCQLVAQFQQPLSSYDCPVPVKLFDTSIPDKDVSIVDALLSPSPASTSNSSRISPVTPVMNSPMECLVSFVVSPQEFYCQLSSETGPFDSLMNKLYAYYGEQEEGAPLTGHVVGDYCAAPYSDGSWYRGRIAATPSGQRVSIYYIDYGNTDEVETEKVRELAPEFYSLPAQALKCQLCNLSPVSGQWSEAATTKFQESVLSGANPQVTFVNQLASGGFEVQVGVEGRDAAQVLVEAGLGRMQTSKNVATSAAAQNLSIPVVPAAKGAKYVALVTFAESPHEFYCQVSSPEEKLDAIMTEIDGYCRDPLSVSPAHFTWKSLDYALAQFSEDSLWYRARITKVLKSGTAFEVLYVDFGNSEVVSSDRLRPLRQEFCKLPCQAVKCRLNGSEVYSCTKEKQSEFCELILNGEFDITCASVSSEGTCAVDMKRREDSVDMMGMALDQKIFVPKSIEPEFVPTRSQKTSDATLKVVFPDGVSPDSFHDVVVAHVESPSLLFCQFSLYMADHLDLLMNEIQEHYTSSTGSAEAFLDGADCKVGKFVAAQYSADDLWYRAMVTAVGKSDIEVCFVDYGNREVVPTSKVKRLNQEFTKLPAQAMPCCLAELAPVDGGDWSAEVTEKLFEMVDGKTLVAQIKGHTNLSSKPFSYLDNVQKLEMSLIDSTIGIESDLVSRGLALHVSPAPSPVHAQASVSHVTGNSTKTGLSFPTFTVGQVCEASVAHLDSPSSFWIQLPSADDELAAFNDKLAAVYTSNRVGSMPSVSLVGSICCAKYSEDDSWYRGIVKSKSDKGVEVCFVDYGNSELIQLSDVKALEREFQALPVQAIECKLHNCFPLPESEPWSDTAIGVFSHLVLDKDLSIKFIAHVDNVWEVEVSYEGEDVLSQLVHASLASSREIKPVPEVSTGVSRQVTIPAVKLQPGHTYPVYITFNDSPCKFYCQLVSDSDKLENLMAEIADFYNGNHLEPLIEVGAYCVAQYSGNSAWYRAKILSTDPNGDVEVLFIDYGNSEHVLPNQILALEARFTSLPAQAFCCSLLQSVNEVQFAPKVLESFFAMDVEQEYTIKVTRVAGECHLVDLFDQGGYRVNDTIVGLCEGMEELVMSTPPPLQPQPHPLPHPPLQQPTVTQPSSVEHVSLPLAKSQRKFTHLNYGIGQTVDVYISHVESPTSFYCQPLELAADLDNMMTELGAFMSGGAPVVRLDPASVKPGMICIARYSVDKEWYRAKIEGEVEDGTLVTFVDYGNCEVTTLENIAQIPPHFLSVSIQAIHCSVFEGLDAGMKWSNEQVSEFQSLIPESDHLSLKICGVSGMELQYYVEISSNGGKMDFSSLLEKQIDQVSADLAHVHTGDHSFKPIPHDEASLSVERTDFVQPAAKSESESENGDTEESDTGSEGKPLIKAPFKLSLAVADDVIKVRVVYVKSPSLVYVQRVDCQPELDALSNEIEQYCASFGDVEQEFPQPFHKGDFVLAKFTQDGFWYRAEVIGVDSDGTAKVTFIDYGNEEIISPKDLMMCPENLLELPVQAIPCCLAEVPRRDSWPSSYKQLIDSLVTDKELKATVVLAADQGMISTVTLEDEESKINVAQNVLAKLQEECEMSSSDIIAEEPEEQEIPVDTPEEQEIYTAIDESAPGSLPSQDLLLPGTTHEVYVISCSNAHSFVCQLASASDALESITASLAHLYTDTEQNEKYALKLPVKEGDLVAAEDGLWYRARVRKVDESDQSCEVVFIDYGNSDVVKIDDLRTLDVSLTTHPPLSFECFLSGIGEDVEGETKATADEVMMKIIGDDSCSAEIISVDSSGRLGVNLTTTGSGKDIGAALVEANLVSTSVPHAESNNEDGNIPKTTKSEDLPIENEFPPEERSLISQGDRKREHIVSNIVSLPPRQDLELSTTHEVYVVSCAGPHSFICQLSEYSDALDSVTTLLAKFYSSEGDGSRLYSLKDTPKEGDFVVAQFSQDEEWYRAVVSSCSEDGSTFDLVFVDYGNLESVPLDKLRRPDPSLAIHPPLAYECFLTEVELLPSEDDEVDAEQAASQKMMEVIGEDACTIEVVVLDDSNRPGVVLKTVLDKTSINSLLIEEKLACPLTPVTSESEAVEEGSSNVEQEDQSVVTPVREPSATSKAVLPEETLALDEATPTVEVQEGSVEAESDVTANEVLPPRSRVSLPPREELELASTHEVYVVSCAGPHSFICHLSDYSDALDSISAHLTKLYSSVGDGGLSYALTDTPKEGDFVVAVFSQDQESYRAVVTKVCDGSSSCHIHFVDCGNSEEVSVENLRIPDPCLAAYPPLAYECFLVGIDLSSHLRDEVRKKAAIEEFLRLVNNQSCSMEVLSVDSSGRLKVSLTTSSGADVGRRLVTANLASPVVPTPSTNQSYSSESVTPDEEMPSITDNQESISTATDNQVPVLNEDAEEPLPSPDEVIVLSSDSSPEVEIATKLSKLSLDVGVRHPAEVVSVETLDCFVCRLTTKEKELCELTDDLKRQGYVKGEGDSLSIAAAKEGTPVAACHPKDDSWHRAEVLSLGREPNTVKILYVDRGDKETVPFERVRLLEKRFADVFPAQRLVCSLPVLTEADLNPPQFAGEPWELVWPISSIKLFSKLTNTKAVQEEGSTLYLEVIEEQEDVTVVKVIKSLAGGEEIDVRCALVEKLREPKPIQFDDGVCEEEADGDVLNQDICAGVSEGQEATGEPPFSPEQVLSSNVEDESVALHARTPSPQPDDVALHARTPSPQPDDVALHARTPSPQPDDVTGEAASPNEAVEGSQPAENCVGVAVSECEEMGGDAPTVKVELRDSLDSGSDEWLDASQDASLTEPSTSDVVPDATAPAVPTEGSEEGQTTTECGGMESAKMLESVNGSEENNVKGVTGIYDVCGEVISLLLP